MPVQYEWTVEEMNADGDVIDSWFYATASEAKAEQCKGPQHDDSNTLQIGVVRDLFDAHDGLQDRTWAYVDEDGRLPGHFVDAGGCECSRVPVRILRDWQ